MALAAVSFFFFSLALFPNLLFGILELAKASCTTQGQYKVCESRLHQCPNLCMPVRLVASALELLRFPSFGAMTISRQRREHSPVLLLSRMYKSCLLVRVRRWTALGVAQCLYNTSRSRDWSLTDSLKPVENKKAVPTYFYNTAAAAFDWESTSLPSSCTYLSFCCRRAKAQYKVCHARLVVYYSSFFQLQWVHCTFMQYWQFFDFTRSFSQHAATSGAHVAAQS